MNRCSPALSCLTAACVHPIAARHQIGGICREHPRDNNRVAASLIRSRLLNFFFSIKSVLPPTSVSRKSLLNRGKFQLRWSRPSRPGMLACRSFK